MGLQVPKANLTGMAWRWRDFSVGLYVPLLELTKGLHFVYTDGDLKVQNENFR